MKFDGRIWRKSNTVVTLPEYDGVNVQFGKVCEKDDPGAVLTKYTKRWPCGSLGQVYAKKIEGTGYSLTNMMYGKPFVRDGEVRIKAYLAYGGKVYTTSWVHKNKTDEYQRKKCEKCLNKA